MKRLLPILLFGLLGTGCASGTRQSGNLARVITSQLKEYGADLPHIDLEQPGMGIAQMYTTWRRDSDPGGFCLTFREGTFDYVLHQMNQIAGNPLPTSDGDVQVWQMDHVAHLDLVRLSDGRAQLTCRRLPSVPPSLAATERPLTSR